MNTKQQHTILIVDDRQHDRETFRRYLLADQEYTYTILEEESAEQALALCSKIAIDTILLDFLLPGMEGLEFLGELKKVTCHQFSNRNYINRYKGKIRFRIRSKIATRFNFS